MIDDTQPIARVPRRRQAVLRVTVVVLVLALGSAGLAAADALSTPGNDSAGAKLAEWGRDHGLGGLITWLEGLKYAADQPAIGGVPPGGIPTANGMENPAPGRTFGGGDAPLPSRLT